MIPLTEQQQPTNELFYGSALLSTPPSAPTAASATNIDKQKSSSLKYWVNRVREAFPHYRRGEIESYLCLAISYVSTTVEEGDDKDECAFRTVMTVLAEEGIKSSVSSSSLPSSTYFIPDERFAAAAIGGRVDVIGGDSATTSSAPMKRKTAHLVCQCCFVEYEFHSMVSCRYGGHLFCMECLRKHTEQRVFGNGNFGKVCAIAAGQKQIEQGPDDQRESNGNEDALELLCMASDCVSGFDDRVLSKALPKKVLDRYDELRFKANIERANMPDVSTCPKCDFTAVVAIHRDPRKHLLFNCPKCHMRSTIPTFRVAT